MYKYAWYYKIISGIWVIEKKNPNSRNEIVQFLENDPYKEYWEECFGKYYSNLFKNITDIVK